MVSSPFADVGFGSSGGDEFIEDGLLSRRGAQNAAKPLDMFADGTGAGYDDADGGFGNIHAFIEDFGCHEHGKDALAEGVQQRTAFGDFRVVGKNRQAEALPDFIGRCA